MNLYNSFRIGYHGARLDYYQQALQSGDLGVLPWVFCVLTERRNKVKAKAAGLLYRELQKMDFDGLIRTDIQMRQTTSSQWYIDWSNLSVEDLFTKSMDSDIRRTIVIFASFSPSGFIREQAIYMMKQYDGTLPFAILRLNDWVEQVRTVAGETAD